MIRYPTTPDEWTKFWLVVVGEAGLLAFGFLWFSWAGLLLVFVSLSVGALDGRRQSAVGSSQQEG